MNRRAFVTRLGFLGTGLLARKVVEPAQATAPQRTRLILLGTGGGPLPKRTRSAPAQVVLAAGEAYVIDCGNGIARQLVRANVPLSSIRHVFITHNHSDHIADYGTLLLLAWTQGMKNVDTWGPPPLDRTTQLFLEMSEPDISVRIADEGRPPLAPLIHPHEITADGAIVRNDAITVRCAVVQHPEVPLSFAYRFDGPDRSIVISGDTHRSENLIRLARGADVLVHEALSIPGYFGARDPMATTLGKHIVNSHTTVEEAGRVAADAGVKMLVLSHFVPGEIDQVDDEAWMAGAAKHFKGRIIVGRDLMEI